MLIHPDPKIVNTRGCGPLMNYWYRRGFWENIFMGLFGMFIGVYMFFVFQRNYNEYIHLRDEADDRKRILNSQSMTSFRSMNSNVIKHQIKNNLQRFPYNGMRNSPSNGTTTGYDSDNNSSSILYQSRVTYHPNP